MGLKSVGWVSSQIAPPPPSCKRSLLLKTTCILSLNVWISCCSNKLKSLLVVGL